MIGTVENINNGIFHVKDENGNTRILQEGDLINENDTVYGDNGNSSSSKIEILLSGNDVIVLSKGEKQLIDSSLIEIAFGIEELFFTKEIFENFNDDITNQATAEGEETVEDKDKKKDEFLERDAAEINVVSNLRTQSFTPIEVFTKEVIEAKREINIQNNNLEFNEEQIPESEPILTPTIIPPLESIPEPYVTKIILSAPTEVIEGDEITVTATVDNAPKTDLIITLNNGEQIKIKTGEFSGSVTTTPYMDDKYIQGDRTYDISISNVEGGEYEKLDTTSKLDIIVKDDEDVTKIILSTPTEVIEGDEITVTATVDNAPKTDLYVLLDNEQLITIKAGEFSGKVTFKNPYADNVYIQSDRTYDISISNTEGGGYEKLDTTSKLDIIVKDDEDVTKIILSTPTEVIEGDEITVTATVDNAPKTDLYVLLDNEQLITIKAGEFSGKVTFKNPYADNVYIQSDRTYDISISNAEGGGYEKLDTTSKLDIIVKDDEDVTKIILSAPTEVIEGDEITVTATVDNAPKTDLYVLLDNEQLITIKAGEFSGKVTFKNPYADNVYIQSDRTYDISISNAEGGGYEKLDTTSKLDIIVKDDEDVTTVSINKIEVAEELTIYRANSTTENTGKSNFVYLENKTDNLLLEAHTKNDELVQIEMKDFYIKNNAWGKDEQGSFLEFVLTIPEPNTNDLIFLANNLLKPKNSFEENSNKVEFITIKAGETTGIGKYYITEFKNLPYTDEPREVGTGASFNEDASSSSGNLFFALGGSQSVGGVGNDFNLIIKGDSTIDTTTIDIAEVIDNFDGTMTLKIELSNPPMENGRIGGSGRVSFFINGKHYGIPFESGVQEYYLTVEKEFDTNGSIKITHFHADAYFEDISIPDKNGDSSVAVIIKQGYDTYEIETSNPPDGNNTATIEKTSIDYNNNVTKEIYEVNLDKNGKGTLVINTDSTQKSTNLKILEIDGNFEKVDFVNNDINLSNLENIIANNHINLKNEKIDNVNITLEDVLKLAPEKELTINCDNFDNLNFKDTISNGMENNWNKTTGIGPDSGYDIYTNSGDTHLKVKVEQSISDGII